jgi:2,4-dienoyl-CoA reductase (NADPH2)
VTLWEASSRLGGRLVAAGRCDEPIDRFVGWLRHELDGSGVAVALGVDATADLVARGSFDEVIVATGAAWSALPYPGSGGPLVHTVDALAPWLADDGELVGRRVVVIGGGKAGLSLADLASRRGRDVTIVEPTAVFGAELGLPGRFELVATLEERGVRFAPGLVVDGFDADGVSVHAGDGGTERLPADAVLLAVPVGPADVVSKALSGAGIPHRVIGDCRRVGMLEGALLDAADVGMTL